MTATQKTREALMTALKAYPQSRSPSVKQLQRALDDSDARARKAVAAEPSGLYAVFKSLRTVRRSFRDATPRRTTDPPTLGTQRRSSIASHRRGACL